MYVGPDDRRLAVFKSAGLSSVDGWSEASASAVARERGRP